MTGPENYAEAERLVEMADNAGIDSIHARLIAQAQVHATLALAAATVATGSARHDPDWHEAVNQA
jgi:hypothetical protein